MAQHKDRDKRPTGGYVDFSTVPEEIRILRQWIMWRFDWSIKTSAWVKVPYQVSGIKASSQDSDTWATFDTVMLTFEESKSSFDGIGFVFANGYAGVDLDECLTDTDGDHILSEFAQKSMSRLDTYTEISPSGTGIHCIGRGILPQGFNRTINGNKVEAYSSGRYFTFTGRSWHENPLPVGDIQGQLDKLVAFLASPDEKPNVPQEPMSFSVQQRIDSALKNPKIADLFYGNTIAYSGDDSAADLALCASLAFYTDGTESCLDTMFRQSGLMRPKWDERRGVQTYGQITLAKAMQGKTEFIGRKKQPRPKVVGRDSSYESRRLRRFTMDDLKDQVIEYYRNGGSRGVSPGWPELEPFYRPAPSMLSIITGEPGSGKSNWLVCLCSKIALKHNWKFTFASFETLPIARHVLTLCQIHLQRPTLKWMQDAVTEDELIEAIDALKGHFHFIMPDDHELDIASILAYVEDDIKDYGVNGFVLDPFTELEQSRFNGLSQTEAVERILRELQRFTRQRQIHTWLIAHPTKSGETYKNDRPTMRSISGSANFYNKADFGLVVQRHDDDRVTVHIDKVRFDSNGQRGSVDFLYLPIQREYMALKPSEV